MGQECQNCGALLCIVTCKAVKQDKTREARPLGQRITRSTHVLLIRETRTFRKTARAHGFMSYKAARLQR
jgi:hypothetical protein